MGMDRAQPKAVRGAAAVKESGLAFVSARRAAGKNNEKTFFE
jgi:hypothetical protein